MKSLLSLVRSITQNAEQLEDMRPEDMIRVNAEHEIKIDECEEVFEPRVLADGSGAFAAYHDPFEAQVMDRLDPIDVFQILKETTEEVRAALGAESKVTIVLAGPSEIALPMAVKGDRDVLRLAFRSLLALGVDASSGVEGLVRVNMRAGLSSLQVTFEDNGHGLNEIMVCKMEAKGNLVRNAKLVDSVERAALIDVRQMLEREGVQLEMSARLGVGARVVVEIPRVDSYARRPAAANAVLRPLQRELREIMSPSDSGSRHA